MAARAPLGATDQEEMVERTNMTSPIYLMDAGGSLTELRAEPYASELNQLLP